jgi:hypothetical protein
MLRTKIGIRVCVNREKKAARLSGRQEAELPCTSSSTHIASNLTVPGPCTAQCLRRTQKAPLPDDFPREGFSLVKMRV